MPATYGWRIASVSAEAIVMTPSSDIAGVDLNSLPPGSMIDVETKSRHYHIECLGGDKIRVSGHPDYCPEPVPAHLLGLLARGAHLKFMLNDRRPVTTSRVISLHVDQPVDSPKADPPKSSPSVN
jgi:hypothetical protein